MLNAVMEMIIDQKTQIFNGQVIQQVLAQDNVTASGYFGLKN